MYGNKKTIPEDFMPSYFYKTIERLMVLIMIFLFPGCAPGPPPPIPPALFNTLIGWIVAGLLIWFAVFLWKNFNSTKATKTDHLADALNAINDRLNSLEKRIDNLERNNK